MSSSSTHAATAAGKRAALRLAFGVTVCFALVEAFDWDATFLAPILAANMLVKLERYPSLAQGVLFVVLIALSSGAVLLLTNALSSSPAVLILALALLMYLTFYAHWRGAPDLATLLPQLSVVTIPVIAVLSPQLSGQFASTLVSAGIAALLVVWLAYAAFPPLSDGPASASAARPAQPPGTASLNALLDTLVLAPALAWFILDATEIAVVALIIIVTLLRMRDAEQSLRAAFGLILANLIGGVAAAIVYSLVILANTFLFFVTACLAASLIFAGRIATAGDRAPVYAIALATFILLLGLGMTPLPGGSSEFFVARLQNVLLASAYTIGGISLTSRWRHAHTGRTEDLSGPRV